MAAQAGKAQQNVLQYYKINLNFTIEMILEHIKYRLKRNEHRKNKKFRNLDKKTSISKLWMVMK